VATISGHPCIKLVEGFFAQRVEAFLPVGAYLHDLRLGQDAQVSRNAGLMDVHALDNVADSAFARLHCLDDAKPGWIRERLEQSYLRIHAYTFSCICHIVKQMFSLKGRVDRGGEQGDQFFNVAHVLEIEDAILDLRDARGFNNIVR